MSPHECDPARGAEHSPSGRQCDRCAHYAACRLCRQSKEEEADRGVLRLVEGHRTAAQTEAPGSVQSGMDLYLRSSGLQPCAYAKADSDSTRRMNGPKCLCRQNEPPAGEQNNTR